MKSIDVKSLLIGALLVSTIFLGVAATDIHSHWAKEQSWEVGILEYDIIEGTYSCKADKAIFVTGVYPKGYEPVQSVGTNKWAIRKRIDEAHAHAHRTVAELGKASSTATEKIVAGDGDAPVVADSTAATGV